MVNRVCCGWYSVHPLATVWAKAGEAARRRATSAAGTWGRFMASPSRNGRSLQIGGLVEGAAERGVELARVVKGGRQHAVEASHPEHGAAAAVGRRWSRRRRRPQIDHQQ